MSKTKIVNFVLLMTLELFLSRALWASSRCPDNCDCGNRSCDWQLKLRRFNEKLDRQMLNKLCSEDRGSYENAICSYGVIQRRKVERERAERLAAESPSVKQQREMRKQVEVQLRGNNKRNSKFASKFSSRTLKSKLKCAANRIVRWKMIDFGIALQVMLISGSFNKEKKEWRECRNQERNSSNINSYPVLLTTRRRRL